MQKTNLTDKVFSKSLKKLKNQLCYDLNVYTIQKQIQKHSYHQPLNVIKKDFKPLKNIIDLKKQIISHKSDKKNIEKEIDKIMKDFLKRQGIKINSNKVHRKNQFHRYRIITEPEQNQQQHSYLNKLQLKKSFLQTDQNNKLPIIVKSKSHNELNSKRDQRRKLKTQIFAQPTQKQKQRYQEYQYIDVKNAIKQYRAGMTSLTKEQKPADPYKKKKQMF